MLNITKYSVDSIEYYEGIRKTLEDSDPGTFVNTECLFMCKEYILNLVTRFEIRQKKILSVGAGRAFEEYWFVKSDNKLIAIDKDADKDFGVDVEEYLKKLTRKLDDSFTYFIGSAGEVIDEISNDSVDILYASSYAPDEIRREEIQEEYQSHQREIKQVSYVSWPEGVNPYDTTLISYAKKVKRGGLVIFQHYKGGIDLNENPNYLSLMKKQFNDNNLELLEIYCFRKSPQNSLVIGYKGSKLEAINYAKNLKSKIKLQKFHGRYHDQSMSSDILKVYDLISTNKLMYKISNYLRLKLLKTKYLILDYLRILKLKIKSVTKKCLHIFNI
jgi:hypothetical protein